MELCRVVRSVGAQGRRSRRESRFEPLTLEPGDRSWNSRAGSCLVMEWSTSRKGQVEAPSGSALDRTSCRLGTDIHDTISSNSCRWAACLSVERGRNHCYGDPGRLRPDLHALHDRCWPLQCRIPSVHVRDPTLTTPESRGHARRSPHISKNRVGQAPILCPVRMALHPAATSTAAYLWNCDHGPLQPGMPGLSCLEYRPSRHDLGPAGRHDAEGMESRIPRAVLHRWGANAVA